MRQSQTGMALIAVLLFLILITVAGVIAVRQGRVDLKVATSDQADTLMLNSSDSVLAHIEQAATGNNTAAYERIMSQRGGVLGYFIVNTVAKEGDQIAFCYQPNEALLFDISKARILKYGGGLQNSGEGICDAGRSGDYVSARNTVMTQVVARGMSGESTTTDAFSAVVQGSGVDTTVMPPNARIQIHSVSVLPSLSSASDSDIGTCLSYPAGVGAADYGSEGANGNMTKCLKDEGIPAVAVVEEGVIKQEEEGGFENGEVSSANTICGNDANCQAALTGQ